VRGPSLANSPFDPRRAELGAFRGAIVARDGSPLAVTHGGTRSYPLGGALGQVLGYLSPRYGMTGLEAAFDSDLRARRTAADPARELGALFTRHGLPAIERGATVVTTIDPAVERALYGALARFPRAAGVALDPRTGAVLALASVPSFDPGRVAAEFPALRANANAPLLDRALDGLYPPGSTFKIFTAATALADGVTTPDATFEDPGFLQVGAATIHDDEGEVPGTQDLAGAFALSSNVDFARLAIAIGPDRWLAAARAWDLGGPLRFELPVARDRLPTAAELSPSVLAQLGFGQADLLVTPLRMATVAATVAAGGTTPRPFLVSAIRRNGRDRPVGRPAALASPISRDVAAQVAVLMRAVVERGTGTGAALPGIAVAGKTGTATNPAGRSDAWFVAFAPAGAPRVAVAVVVENVGYGATYAVPAVRGALAAALGDGS